MVWLAQSGLNPSVSTMLRLPVEDPFLVSPREEPEGVVVMSALTGPRPSMLRICTGSSLGMRPPSDRVDARCSPKTSTFVITPHALLSEKFHQSDPPGIFRP